MAAHKRILLKLSGEALAGGASFGIDPERVKSLGREIADHLKQNGVDAVILTST